MTAQPASTTRWYTSDDLWELSQREGERFELIRGKLYEMSPASHIHGTLANWIAHLITAFVVLHKLGRVYAAETGFAPFPDRGTVLAADVAFIAKARVPTTDEAYPKLAPDLAVEVVSPGDRRTEIHEKVALYFAAGTRQVWVVYPRSRTVYVYHADDQVTIHKTDGVIDADHVLPGFMLSVSDIFSILDDADE